MLANHRRTRRKQRQTSRLGNNGSMVQVEYSTCLTYVVTAIKQAVAKRLHAVRMATPASAILFEQAVISQQGWCNCSLAQIAK